MRLLLSALKPRSSNLWTWLFGGDRCVAGLCWRMVGIGALLQRIRDEHLHEEPSGCPCLCWRMVGIGALPLRMRRSHEGAGVREIPSSSPFSLSESEPPAMPSMASR